MNKDILLVVCGSATSWIVKKVLRSRGGLHNRVTRQMPIRPFTLAGCAQYADYKHLGFDRRQVLECYMAFGGVTYYWSLLEEGKSAAQNFDALFFGETAELRFRCRRRSRAAVRYRSLSEECGVAVIGFDEL